MCIAEQTINNKVHRIIYIRENLWKEGLNFNHVEEIEKVSEFRINAKLNKEKRFVLIAYSVYDSDYVFEIIKDNLIKNDMHSRYILKNLMGD